MSAEPRGKILLRREVLDLRTICHNAVLAVAKSLDLHGVSVDQQLPTAAVWVDADPVRITQIVDNLLTNGVKYTPEGGRVTLLLENQRDAPCSR
jgi:signal transduction histidine kinase